MIPILSFGVLVLLTIGVVEVLKIGFKLNKNICPIIALAVGLILTIVGNLTNLTTLTFLTGIAVGLSACGLFDQKLLLRALPKETVSP